MGAAQETAVFSAVLYGSPENLTDLFLSLKLQLASLKQALNCRIRSL